MSRDFALFLIIVAGVFVGLLLWALVSGNITV